MVEKLEEVSKTSKNSTPKLPLGLKIEKYRGNIIRNIQSCTKMDVSKCRYLEQKFLQYGGKFINFAKLHGYSFTVFSFSVSPSTIKVHLTPLRDFSLLLC